MLIGFLFGMVVIHYDCTNYYINERGSETLIFIVPKCVGLINDRTCIYDELRLRGAGAA